MQFKDKAGHLSNVLHQLVAALQTYDLDDRADYTKKVAKELDEYVDRYDDAVFVKTSRELAENVLTDAKELMININGAGTKGEIEFDNGNLLNNYWELETIFRESKYRNETL